MLNSSVHSSQHAKKTKMINIVNTKTEMRKTEMNDCDKRAARIAFTQSTDSGPVGAGEASLGSCTKGPALIIVHRKRSCHGEGLLLLSMSACAQVETPPPRKVCRPSTRTIPARGSCEARGPHGELRAGAWLRALPGSAWREPCGRAHLSNPDGRHGRRPPKHRTAVAQTRRPPPRTGPAGHERRTARFELGHGSGRRRVRAWQRAMRPRSPLEPRRPPRAAPTKASHRRRTNATTRTLRRSCGTRGAHGELRAGAWLTAQVCSTCRWARGAALTTGGSLDRSRWTMALRPSPELD